MTESYLKIIQQNIEPDTEECSEESEAILILDEEMDKYGSLHESSIDWKRAEETALYVLKERCKNMRVMAHLMLCLQHSRDSEKFVLSIQLLGTFLENHWDSAKPRLKPESRALKINRKILRQILLRSEQASKRLDLTESDRAMSPSLAETVNRLKDEVEKTGIDYDDYQKITDGYEKALPAEVVALKPELANAEKAGQPHNPAAAEENSTASRKKADISIPEINLHGGNERETKQTLFKVARLLNSAMPNEPLGFRMRRFALWFNIASIPALRKDGTTELMAVSSDRVIAYQETLSSAPSEALLLKIEQSVSVSPFWIDGSYLSSRVAEELEMPDVSDAIREETLRFTKRLPDLLDAKFSDGTAYAGSATRRWLASGSGATQQGGSGSEWADKLQQAMQTAESGKYKQALLLLEKGTGGAEQPRDRFYWRLATADFMHKTGMKSLAMAEYRALLVHAEALNLLAWEPSLLEALRQKAEIAPHTESANQ